MTQCNVISLSVFCNTEDKNDDLAFVKELFDEFFQHNFVVSTIQLNNVSVNQNNDGQTLFSKIDRPQIKNVKTNEIINIMPDRIDYILESRVGDDNEVIYPQIEQAENGIKYLESILKIAGKLGSRLALNIHYMLEGRSLNQEIIVSDFYNGKIITESNSRIVTTEVYESNTINIINQTNQYKSPIPVRIDQGQKNFTGVLVHNDINTHQDNMNERFKPEDLDKFFKYFFDVNKNILEGVKNVK